MRNRGPPTWARCSKPRWNRSKPAVESALRQDNAKPSSMTGMTKSDLIARLAARYPQLVAKDADLAVKTILDAMTLSLSEGQRIEIRGFGSFNIRHHAPRVGRNPKTGETIDLPKKVVIHFKPGKEIRDRVDAARGKFRITE